MIFGRHGLTSGPKAIIKGQASSAGWPGIGRTAPDAPVLNLARVYLCAKLVLLARPAQVANYIPCPDQDAVQLQTIIEAPLPTRVYASQPPQEGSGQVIHIWFNLTDQSKFWRQTKMAA